MDAEETAQRERVVAVARSFLGTPYHTGARVKGAGTDCLTLLACIFEEAGLMARIDIPHYPADWHLHRDAERYLEGLLAYTREIEGPPQPGDIVLWKFGRCYSHGAVVVEWPTIIHSFMGIGCVLEDAEASARLTHVGEGNGMPRPKRLFSFWRK